MRGLPGSVLILVLFIYTRRPYEKIILPANLCSLKVMLEEEEWRVCKAASFSSRSVSEEIPHRAFI